jgi:hypothetical protein
LPPAAPLPAGKYTAVLSDLMYQLLGSANALLKSWENLYRPVVLSLRAISRASKAQWNPTSLANCAESFSDIFVKPVETKKSLIDGLVI